jgi:hypothetical protein
VPPPPPPTFAEHQNLSATQVLAASPPVVTSWAIIARMVNSGFDTTCKPGPDPTPPTRVTCTAGGSEYNDPHSKELGMVASSFLVSQYVCGHATGLADEGI